MFIICWFNHIEFVFVWRVERAGYLLPLYTLYLNNAVLSGYITTLKNKQKLDVSSEGPCI
jgi:hypothetical protein